MAGTTLEILTNKVKDQAKEIESLRTRVEILAPTIESGGGFVEPLGLTPTESRVLTVLYEAAGKYVQTPRMMEALYPNRKAKPVANIVGVLCRYIKRKQPWLVIESRYGFGRRLPPETLERLKAVLDKNRVE